MAISAMSQLGILRIGVQEAGMEVRFSGNANQYHVYHNGEPFAFLSLTGDLWTIHAKRQNPGIWRVNTTHKDMSTLHTITRLLAFVGDPLV
jgi:hypothetical protein